MSDDAHETLDDALLHCRGRHGIVARDVIKWLDDCGYVIVPKELTRPMVDAALGNSGHYVIGDPDTVWRAMLAASQQKGG
jgi:hypothetical protein